MRSLLTMVEVATGCYDSAQDWLNKIDQPLK
jgi:hypothetical protein